MTEGDAGAGDSGSQRFVTKSVRAGEVAAGERFPEHVVVGAYSASDSNFVCHVALLAGDTDLGTEAEVSVWHMGPPIVADEGSRNMSGTTRTIRADLVSDIGLTIPERNRMKTWRAKVDRQKRPRLPFQQYKIVPHMAWERSERGRKVYQRFSCAGFVLECYGAADIWLIDTAAELPKADIARLREAYPTLVRIEGMDPRAQAKLGYKGREDLGLVGDGDWPILLAGYLFHSLKRGTSENPRPVAYIPANIDEAEYE